MGTLSVSQIKLQKRLRRLTGEAVADFNMIEDGDKVMVCLSGGKDSYTMLDVLMHLQKVAPMGDPIEIRVRSYELTLRVEEAKKIEIEGVPA